MSTIQHKIDLVKFLRRYPDTWHSFASDRQTIEVVCAAANLRILKLSPLGDQMILASRENADLFLSRYED